MCRVQNFTINIVIILDANKKKNQRFGYFLLEAEASNALSCYSNGVLFSTHCQIVGRLVSHYQYYLNRAD